MNGRHADVPKNIPTCQLPTECGEFVLHGFFDQTTGAEHVALVRGNIGDGMPVLTRVHSECLTGDALFSQRCDCGAQLKSALQTISAEGRGVLLYLRQEGRGIGLINKIRAYSLQDGGADTVDANHQLGFPADLRKYDICKIMLEQLNVNTIILMSNNPEKFQALERLGISIVKRMPLRVKRTLHNTRYLTTKANRLGHLI